MKTEAPKKLYFGEYDKSVLDIYSNKEPNDEIEYTRTDILEAKEVDLEKEIDNYFDNYKLAKKEECWLNHDQAHIFAKHFFELGLKAQKGE